jgi:hypothetical protein
MTELVSSADSAIRDDAVVQDVRDFLGRLELRDIQVTRWQGKLADQGGNPLPTPAEQVSATVRGAFRFGGDIFQCLWSLDFPISSDAGEDVAKVGVSLVETFSLSESENRPQTETVLSFMRKHAFPIAMPHIREALQTMTARLGLGSIVLGLIHQGEPWPRVATLRAFFVNENGRVDGQRGIEASDEE